MNKDQQLIYDRLAEIVPIQSFDDLEVEDFEKSLKIAFEILGISLKNPEKFTGKSLENWMMKYSNSLKNPSLFQAIFQVWWDDNEF